MSEVSGEKPTGFSNQYPLCGAAFNTDLAEVRRLLADGADPNFWQAGYDPPLHSAIEGGNPEIVKAMLDTGADPNMRGPGEWTPLARAIDLAGDADIQNYPRKHPELVEAVRMLLLRGADPRMTVPSAGRFETPLDLAAYYAGTPELVMLVFHSLGGTDVQSLR
jgi:ankyrin repeat protein